eukprot:TRINITY_DN3040_c0_g1_i2.p3 TRINITY_DN3040_c0_g1~~TRINITY_DN3040_c0_g1_i2.p3  ORF type:complete len:90 (+),score=6.21 TRINITY_DN3040_c0_g1_i2:70-339(+)
MSLLYGGYSGLYGPYAPAYAGLGYSRLYDPLYAGYRAPLAPLPAVAPLPYAPLATALPPYGYGYGYGYGGAYPYGYGAVEEVVTRRRSF